MTEGFIVKKPLLIPWGPGSSQIEARRSGFWTPFSTDQSLAAAAPTKAAPGEGLS